jgi:deoxyribodipyrimidine photolyase-like uncharacterized protein
MMILLYSEKQCIYMYRGKRRRMAGRRMKSRRPAGGEGGWDADRTYQKTTNLCKKCSH